MQGTQAETPNEVRLYMKHAFDMLAAAEHNSAAGFLGTAVNRSYYAVFYAACALLATRGLSRSRHTGVIAAFRQHFVKSGLMEAEFGEIYGRVMDDRHISDYDVAASIEPDQVKADLADARRFVERIERYLQEDGN